MEHARRISVTGLGYVGLPVAVAFGRLGTPVVGFDTDAGRIAELRRGHDRTGEVDADELMRANVLFSSDPTDLQRVDFHIVAVPTPVDEAKLPDLRPMIAASRTLGRALKPGDIVVYESTVYPGTTEEECVPVLEAESGLRFGRDFSVGYSPERINPGDRTHRFHAIRKVVAASDPATLDIVAAVYGSVVTAGIHRAPTIRTAEAAKVIENTQRDLNVALMNELSVIFHRLGIDCQDVLAAAGTKWNFLPFTPGLVGGHCIGVDPYYLTHCAQRAGYHPEVILAGRRINDTMGRFIAQEVVRGLLQGETRRPKPLVTVLGLSFKEDVPDIRNTRVIDIVRELQSFGLEVQVHDPLADAVRAHEEFGLTLVALEALRPANAVVVAVAHAPFRAAGWPGIVGLLREGRGLVADVKAILDRAGCPPAVTLWRL